MDGESVFFLCWGLFMIFYIVISSVRLSIGNKEAQKKIVKDGRKTDRKYKVRCRHCSCEFVFIESEWFLGFWEVEEKVTCPCCGRRFYPYDRTVITDEEYDDVLNNNGR